MKKICIGAKVQVNGGTDKGQVGVVAGISGIRGETVIVSLEKKGFLTSETVIKHFKLEELTALDETTKVLS